MAKKHLSFLMAIIFVFTSSINLLADDFKRNQFEFEIDSNNIFDDNPEESSGEEERIIKIEQNHENILYENIHNMKSLNTMNEYIEREEVLLGKARSSSEVIEISTFDDLKNQLEEQEQKFNALDNGKKLFLKNSNYKLMDDIEIDLSDSFFDGKYDLIKNGILSIGNSDNDSAQTTVPDTFIFDGNNYKITIIPKSGEKALPLFGSVISGASFIKDLSLVIDGDVIGYPFADIVSSKQSENSEGYIKANGLVENIDIKVKGSVIPQFYPYEESRKRNSIFFNRLFSGNFTGSMATGFAIQMIKTSLNNIRVDIDGDVGSSDAKVLDQDYLYEIQQGGHYSVGAFGFLW